MTRNTSVMSGWATAILLVSLAATAWAGPPTASQVGDETSSGQLAQADTTVQASDSSRSDLGPWVIGLHVGVLLPVFSDLGVFVMPRLEIGYIFPAIGSRLEIFISGAWTAPEVEGNPTDTRLPPANTYSFAVTQQQLLLGTGLYMRLFELGETINPYMGLGPLLFLLETEATGSANGNDFGENTVTDTEFGLYTSLGLELVFGPGSGFFEVGLTWSDLDHFITGDSNTGAITPTLGYRFMF